MDIFDELDPDLLNPIRIDFDQICEKTFLAVCIVVRGTRYWIFEDQIVLGTLREKQRGLRKGGSLEIPEWLAIEKGLA